MFRPLCLKIAFSCDKSEISGHVFDIPKQYGSVCILIKAGQRQRRVAGQS